MGLKKDIKIKVLGDIEINIKDAYIKVDYVSGNKDRVYMQVSIYKEKSCENIMKKENYSFIPNMEDNFIKQSYEYLKTLDEFKDAKDV